jgi:imidazolonepropionase
MLLLFKHIKLLVLAETDPQTCYRGSEMEHIPMLEDAWLLVRDGLIADFGTMTSGCPSENDVDEVVSAEGRMVLPAWCDSHTHLVFAAPREQEFEDRIKGLSYEEIALRGGGILNSAARLAKTSEDDLFDMACVRLREVILMGTGAIEIKSGYGLSIEGELKMLRVIRRLQNISPIPIKATFLGAHAFPSAYKENHAAYISLIINEMLPAIGRERLADYCDVFCERNYFTPEETSQVLVAAKQYGLKPKIHANQLDYSGGVQVGVQHGAISVDHLEHCGEAEIAALRKSDTVPTLLPSCSFFIRIPYAPARQLIDANLPVALATDFNPGSTPSGRMAFVVSLACIYMRMLPAEAICAATINGAHAMELSDQVGSIAVGKRANLILTKPIPSLAYIPYAFGTDVIEQVFINGERY